MKKFEGKVVCWKCGYHSLTIVVLDGSLIFAFPDATDPKTWDGKCQMDGCDGVILPDANVTLS